MVENEDLKKRIRPLQVKLLSLQAYFAQHFGDERIRIFWKDSNLQTNMWNGKELKSLTHLALIAFRDLIPDNHMKIWYHIELFVFFKLIIFFFRVSFLSFLCEMNRFKNELSVLKKAIKYFRQTKLFIAEYWGSNFLRDTLFSPHQAKIIARIRQIGMLPSTYWRRSFILECLSNGADKGENRSSAIIKNGLTRLIFMRWHGIFSCSRFCSLMFFL